MNTRLHRTLDTITAGTLLLLLAALPAQPPLAQGMGPFTAAPRPAQDELPVPDPGALKPGWWDYLAPGSDGMDKRAAALLAAVEASASSLPAAEAVQATPLIERLRIGLAALPAMYATQPGTLAEVPTLQETYTPAAVVAIDRAARDLQDELDERLSAISVGQRALRDGQRRADNAFAAYIASPSGTALRVVDGLEMIADRVEIAINEQGIRVRKAEAGQLTERIVATRALRDAAAERVVPDPERPPERIRDLIEENRVDLAQARSEILRQRAQRLDLAGADGTERQALDRADLGILAAILHEHVLSARIDLLETELDWLSIAAGDLDSAAIAEIDARLQERRAALTAIAGDAQEWNVELQQLVASGLRRGLKASAGSDMDPAFTKLGRTALLRASRLRGLHEDLLFALDRTSLMLASRAGWRGWLQARLLRPGRAAISTVHQGLGTSLFRISDAPVTSYGLLRVALIMVLAVGVSRLARHLLARFGARQTGSTSAGLYTVGRLLHYVLIAAGLMIGLASIGLNLSQLALVAGALSIGIGFGLQSIVNNFVSGLIILFEQSLKIGDVVELDSGVRGVVREIRVRSTLITTSDAIDIIVPNSEFVAGKVTNFTLREPYHRIHVPFGVAYDSDKDEVRRVVAEAARAVPFTHVAAGREPDAWLVRFGDNSLDFELVVWINPSAVTRPGAVAATYLWEIESALRRHGIQIPFPQRDVHLRLPPSAVAEVQKAMATPAP